MYDYRQVTTYPFYCILLASRWNVKQCMGRIITENTRRNEVENYMSWNFYLLSPIMFKNVLHVQFVLSIYETLPQHSQLKNSTGFQMWNRLHILVDLFFVQLALLISSLLLCQRWSVAEILWFQNDEFNDIVERHFDICFFTWIACLTSTAAIS